MDLEKEIWNLKIKVNELEDKLKELNPPIMYAKCPECGSKELEYNPCFTLNSFPPQYEVRCRNCNRNFYIRADLKDKIKYQIEE